MSVSIVVLSAGIFNGLEVGTPCCRAPPVVTSPESLQSGHCKPLRGIGYQYCRQRQEPPQHGVRHWPNPFPRRRPDRAGPPKPIRDSNGEQPASYYLKVDAMTPSCKSTKQLTAFPLQTQIMKTGFITQGVQMVAYC